MKIQIYGDSLMKGVLVDANYKYKQSSKALLEQLTKNTGIEAVNRAHFGYTSTKGQAILNRDLSSGLDCQVALLEFGGNDCDHNWKQVAEAPHSEHLPNTPLQSFLHTIRTMAHSLQVAGIQPLLMTLPPLDAQKYLDFIGRLGSDTRAVLSWLGDVQAIYRWQEMYSHAISRLAGELQLPLVDVRSRFLSRNDCSTLIARDGIHLTQGGYSLLFSELQNTLLAMG